MKRALVLAFTFVLALGITSFAAPLSGSWDMDITFDITGLGVITVSSFASTLIVDYTVGGWTFGSVTGFDLSGWIKQEFSAGGVLGAFTVDSDLVFNPSTVAFTSWDTTVGVSIAGVAFDAEFLLADGAGWTFGTSGVAGDLSIAATAYFNMNADGDLVQTGTYCFCFTSIDFEVSFPFACIDLVNITLAFSQSGFDYVLFEVDNIAIPGLSFLVVDMDLRFTVDTKTLTIAPELVLGDPVCIEFYIDLLGPAPKVTGIEIYALGLEYTWNGVSFSSLSVFSTDKYIALIDPYWDDNYWEVFTIESVGDSCCGGAIDFSVATYFLDTHTSLFDWGKTDVDLSFGIGSSLEISTGLVVDTTGLTKLSLGFEVTF